MIHSNKNKEPLLIARFYQTNAGTEPVRAWLKSLDRADMKLVGTAIRLVQYRWPLGMPQVRKLESELWEVRAMLKNGAARVLFTVVGRYMVLLHGFTKKSRKTPPKELAVARERLLRTKEGRT